MKYTSRPHHKKSIALAIAAFLFGLHPIFGQGKQSIQGMVTDLQNESPISFATVTLHTTQDTSLVTGTISNDEGQFVIAAVPKGHYYLRVSFIGYQPQMQEINFAQGTSYNTGKIPLKQVTINMEEAVVVADRIKAKTSADQTTFFVNKKMNDVSNTGVDILKHLPGIQVDLMQNLTLEGSQNILILVNGRERDLNYVSQLNAKQIDKVEIIHNPGPKYDAHITGVLNIILKERESGLNGHLYAEMPTTESVIFLNPSFSLNYGTKKMNMYTAYDGNFHYFDVTEENIRGLEGPSGPKTFRSELNARQKSYNHRFHYGVDLFLNPRNQFNFYAFFSPSSFELDGNISMQAQSGTLSEESARAQREDTDRNYRSYYSLYYKHLFAHHGQEITFDLSHYYLNGETTSQYDYQEASNPNFSDVINRTNPRQHSTSLRIDFTSPLSKSIRLDAGTKSRITSLKDESAPLFKNSEDTHAAYMALSYNHDRLQVSAGLRAEYSCTKRNQGTQNEVFALLPHARINMQINKKQKLQLTYRGSIQRPHIFQLNPTLSIIDPVTIQRGNPDLEPAFPHHLSLDYILLSGNNYFCTKLFYSKTTQTIQNLSHINASELLETRIENAGTIQQYGIQLTGALKLGKAISFSPYFKLSRIQSSPNALAKRHNISRKNNWAYESGFSATVNIKKDLAASLLFQYNSPTYDLQNKRYSDALYFLSLEKTFKKRINIGISTAIPFVRTFTYSGVKTQGANFYSSTEGNIHTTLVPIGIHVRYQFNRGKKVRKIKRQKEKLDNIPKKGF